MNAFVLLFRHKLLLHLQMLKLKAGCIKEDIIKKDILDKSEIDRMKQIVKNCIRVDGKFVKNTLDQSTSITGKISKSVESEHDVTFTVEWFERSGIRSYSQNCSSSWVQ